MSIMIRYGATPLEELLRSLCETVKDFPFFPAISAACGDIGGLPEVWALETDRLRELNDTDRELLKGIGSALGSSDIDGQTAMLSLNAELFRKQLSEACYDREKKSGLYRSIGLLAGIGAAVIIM